MEIQQLKSFLGVAKFCNFTKAADHLNYSQSTVSEHIQSLETLLGVKLFDRLGRQTCLTENGITFLPYAEQITSLCTESTYLFKSHNISGNLTVAVAETLCIACLPDLIKSFKDKYPNVQISLKVANCSEFPSWLRKNFVDLAFTLNDDSSQTDLVCRDLYNEPIILISNPRHPLAHKTHVTAADFRNQTLILTEQACKYRGIFEEILANHKACPQSIIECESIVAIKQCVMNDLGLSLLPRIAVKKEIEAGQLVELRWKGQEICVIAQMSYHKKKWFSPTLQLFTESVIDYIDRIRTKT